MNTFQYKRRLTKYQVSDVIRFVGSTNRYKWHGHSPHAILLTGAHVSCPDGKKPTVVYSFLPVSNETKQLEAAIAPKHLYESYSFADLRLTKRHRC